MTGRRDRPWTTSSKMMMTIVETRRQLERWMMNEKTTTKLKQPMKITYILQSHFAFQDVILITFTLLILICI